MNKTKNTTLKKLISFTVASSLLFTSIPIITNATASETKLNIMIDKAEQETDALIDSVDNQLNVSKHGIYSINESKINLLIDNMNLNDIISTYAYYGVEITKKDLVDMLISNIEETNEEIVDGDLILLENGSLIESDDNEFYLEGGQTKNVKKWWGVRMYKSTSSANSWVRTLQKGANANNLAAAIAGAATAGAWGIGGLPNALFGWYLGNMAADASYHNSRSNNGIIADIRFIISYKITKQ